MNSTEFFYLWKKGKNYMEHFVHKQTRFEYLKSKQEDCIFASTKCSPDMSEIWLNHARKLQHIIDTTPIQELSEYIS